MITDIVVSPRGEWWVYARGLQGQLFYRSVEGGWSVLPAPGEGNSRRVYLALSPNGTLWLSNLEGYEIAAIAPQEYLHSGGKEGYNTQVVYSSTHKDYLTLTRLGFAKDGTLWGINSRSLVSASQPDRLLDGVNLNFSPLIVKVEEFADLDYKEFLHDTNMTDLAVDDGDNLWVGTDYAGVVHFNPRTRELLHHYHRGNTPLPSNFVTALAYHSKTGELYIGTNRGLVSVLTDSQAPAEDLESIRVFPNPVRPEFQGDVTIDGLMARTVVKITTVAGDLVRELLSNGGRVQWDQRNTHGNLVASGVYLIFCSDEEGKVTNVAKVAIVR